MNPNIFRPLPIPSDDEIREILVKRVDQQKQAVGIVVGVIEPAGRRVVAYGHLANGDPRTLDGDTIFEIGSIPRSSPLSLGQSLKSSPRAKRTFTRVANNQI